MLVGEAPQTPLFCIFQCRLCVPAGRFLPGGALRVVEDLHEVRSGFCQRSMLHLFRDRRIQKRNVVQPGESAGFVQQSDALGTTPDVTVHPVVPDVKVGAGGGIGGAGRRSSTGPQRDTCTAGIRLSGSPSSFPSSGSSRWPCAGQGRDILRFCLAFWPPSLDFGDKKKKKRTVNFSHSATSQRSDFRYSVFVFSSTNGKFYSNAFFKSKTNCFCCFLK